MDRTDLQRLSKDELIELVIQLQRPDKTSGPPSAQGHARRAGASSRNADLRHEVARA
jgi:transposase